MKKLVLFLLINISAILGFSQVNCLQDSVLQFQESDTKHIKNYVRSTTTFRFFDSSGCIIFELEGVVSSYVEVFERTLGMDSIGLIGRFVVEENIYSLRMIEGVTVIDSESTRKSLSLRTFL
ncbi:hypothetical protein [Crocinitomix catalasitica]|uniref:hypothetical protein n=1 Tax=Crocinitomix catalasitica TaxID=184607 RepID=UPI0004847506|nr:hypothetical protein [Crocinitomix catalasitica]